MKYTVFIMVESQQEDNLSQLIKEELKTRFANADDSELNSKIGAVKAIIEDVSRFTVDPEASNYGAGDVSKIKGAVVQLQINEMQAGESPENRKAFERVKEDIEINKSPEHQESLKNGRMAEAAVSCFEPAERKTLDSYAKEGNFKKGLTQSMAGGCEQIKDFFEAVMNSAREAGFVNKIAVQGLLKKCVDALNKELPDDSKIVVAALNGGRAPSDDWKG